MFWACSTGGGGGLGLTSVNTGGAPSVFAAGGNGTSNPSGIGSSPSVSITGSSTDPDSGVVYRRPKVCDSNGENCKCMNLASFGERASSSYGVGSDGQPSSTTAFDTWLNEKSNATVTMVISKPSLTAEYLAGFDVIILQDLRNWSLSADELKNVEDWVNGGGGLISLNGYMNNDDAEVTATNKVINFTGMSYNGGGPDGSVPKGDCPESSKNLCPQSNSACCYCWNNTVPLTEWNTSHPVALNINAIGAYMGRSINAGDGEVVLKFEGKTVAASKDIGAGKAFLFCDEWVTYTSQWSGGQVNEQNANQWEPCYVASDDPPHWMTADYAFQTMQFWYNAIHYVAPPSECDFVIHEPPERIILL